MQDSTLNRNDNGPYREQFYFDIFDLRYMLNFVINLNLNFCEWKESIAILFILVGLPDSVLGLNRLQKLIDDW